MKRIISLLLCMCILSFGICSFAEETMKDAQYSERIEKLAYLDITFDEGSEADKPVSRARFVRTILEFVNASVNGGKSIFLDVDEDHPFKDVIMTGANKGYMIGYDDGNFYPNRIISVPEAIKVIVNTLGYELVAMNNGGYPNGYLSLASEIGLTKGVNSGEAELTYSQFSKLLENALECDIMKIKFDGTDVNYSDDGEIDALWEFHNTVKVKATVTANAITGIDKETGKTGKTNRVKLNGEEVEVGESNIDDYLGYTVEAYISYDDDKDLGEVKFAKVSDKNEVITLKQESILGESTAFSAYNFVYETETGKIKNIEITDEIDVIYNGIAKPNYEKNDLIPEVGNVTLIDNDGDGEVDCIKIFNAKKIIVVSNVATDDEGVKIYDEKDANESYLYDEEYENYVIYVDGERTEPGAISKDMVVLIGENGQHSETYAFSKTVTGKIEYLGKISGTEKEEIVINGVSYVLAPGCENYPFALGKSGTFRVDNDNNVYAFYKMSAEGLKYGYFIRGYYDEAEDNEKAEIGVLTLDDEIVRFKINQKVKYNGRTEKVEKVMSYLKNGSKWEDQLIMYELNENGELKALATAQSKDDESADLRFEALWLQYSSVTNLPAEYRAKYGLNTDADIDNKKNSFLDVEETAYLSKADSANYGYYNGSWGNVWWEGSETIRFTVNKDNPEESFVGASWGYNNYHLKFYNESKETNCVGAVVFEMTGESTLERITTGKVPAIVKTKQQMLDENDNPVEVIVAVENGKDVIINWNDNADMSIKNQFDSLEAGDIFYYEFNAAGKLKTIYRALDYSKLSDENYSEPGVRYGNSQCEVVEIHGTTTSDGGNWFEARMAFHKIDKKLEGGFYEYKDYPKRGEVPTAVRRKQKITSNAGVYSVEKIGSKVFIKTISWDDVQNGDEVFIHAKHGAIQAMYVFKD